MASPAGSPKGVGGGYVGLAGKTNRQSPAQPKPSGSAGGGKKFFQHSQGSSTPRPSPEEHTPRHSNGQPAPPQAPAAAPSGPSGTRAAIVISGCTGKYKLINETYEPLQMTHKDRPCWRARSSAPVYLFHTGKSRWVISKRINDGAAFVPDNGSSDPTQCPGPWMCCSEDNNWVKDENIKCATAQASNDQFTLLRSQVEDELAQYGLMDDKSLRQMWRKLDSNGNNVVSLAEIDALVVDMTKAGLWPDWLNNKESIRRAYEKTIKLDSEDHDDWVEKEEFHSLLLNLFWFGHLHEFFDTSTRAMMVVSPGRNSAQE